jgi:hypothetical protein
MFAVEGIDSALVFVCAAVLTPLENRGEAFEVMDGGNTCRRWTWLRRHEYMQSQRKEWGHAMHTYSLSCQRCWYVHLHKLEIEVQQIAPDMLPPQRNTYA